MNTVEDERPTGKSAATPTVQRLSTDVTFLTETPALDIQPQAMLLHVLCFLLLQRQINDDDDDVMNSRADMTRITRCRHVQPCLKEP